MDTNNKEIKNIRCSTEEAVEFTELNGETWELIITKHAALRTYDRHTLPEMILCVLKEALIKMGPAFANLSSEEHEYVVLHIKALSYSFVLHIDNAGKKVRIVTFQDQNSFYPREGDVVISIRGDGSITKTVWQKAKVGADYPSPVILRHPDN